MLSTKHLGLSSASFINRSYALTWQVPTNQPKYVPFVSIHSKCSYTLSEQSSHWLTSHAKQMAMQPTIGQKQHEMMERTMFQHDGGVTFTGLCSSSVCSSDSIILANPYQTGYLSSSMYVWQYGLLVFELTKALVKELVYTSKCESRCCFALAPRIWYWFNTYFP